MTTTQDAVTTDRFTAPSERGEQEAMETWTGEWDGAEFTTRSVTDRAFLTDPAWSALPPLSLVVSYLLLVLGVLGAHQFYLRNWFRGGLYLVTLGGLGIALAIDLFTLPRQLEKANALRALGLR